MSTAFPRFVHMFSTARFCGVLVALLAAPIAPVYAQTSSPDATLFRVFLTDGTSLVSYGEYARVADRVVLSMPLGGTPAAPRLQLLSIPAISVNWERTDAYAEAARSARYSATRGPDDFALLGQSVARALSDIAVTTDREQKLAMAIEARQNVTKWAAEHYAYRAADVAHLATLFDGVIADVRSASGARGIELALVANMAAPPDVPLMNAPDLRESADQALRAADLTTDPGERKSLLRAIAETLGGEDGDLAWAASMKAKVDAALSVEERIDKDYASLTARFVGAADRYAQAANVRGVERLQQRVLAEDDRLGRHRPQEMAALLASLDAKLDAARRLRLARDTWAARVEVLRDYELSMAEPAAMLRACRPRLETIRQLEGTPRRTLIWLAGQTSIVIRMLADVTPPAGGEAVHGLFTSAAQLAARAVSSRQQAVSSGEMQPAWEAASAAAGALMLLDRASEELKRLTTVPELK